jgi:16S rRNA (guanine527-N7)-methyltransferase
MFHEEHRGLQGSLDRYTDLVARWAGPLGLVASGDRERWQKRHLGDSLRALPIVRGEPSGPAVDVGSGAGLPGVPLAIAQPDRPWTLIEPRRRRAAFLEEVVRRLDLDCRVVVATAEEAARDPSLAGKHAVAVARALAPPRRSFALLQPLVRPGGIALVFVGRSADLPAEAEEPQEGLAIMRRGGPDVEEG